LITEAALALVWFSSTSEFLFINLEIFSRVREKGYDDTSEERELLPQSYTSPEFIAFQKTVNSLLALDIEESHMSL
jgi:hypothetical protein